MNPTDTSRDRTNVTPTGYTYGGVNYLHQTRYDANNQPYQVDVPQNFIPPASTITATSAFGAGNLPAKNMQLEKALTSGMGAISPTTTSTTTTPTSTTITPQNITADTKLTSDQMGKMGIKDTTGWVSNPDGTFSPGAADLDTIKGKIQAIQTQSLIDTHITPSFQGLSGVKVTSTVDGGISATTSSGAPVSLPKEALYNADGSLNTKSIAEFTNSIKNTEQTVSTAKSSQDQQIASLEARKKTEQVALDRQRQTALANAKAAMAAANPYGMPTGEESAYTAAIEAEFKIQQDALDNKYASVEAQIRTGATEAISKAYSDLSSSVAGIMETAYGQVKGEEKFAIGVKQKAETDLTTQIKGMDWSQIPDISKMTVSDAMKNPALSALIETGKTAGKTAEQTLGYAQLVSPTKQKLTYSQAKDMLNSASLKHLVGMTPEQIKEDPTGSVALAKLTPLYGEAGAMQQLQLGGAKTQAEIRADQKMQNDMQRVSAMWKRLSIYTDPVKHGAWLAIGERMKNISRVEQAASSLPSYIDKLAEYADQLGPELDQAKQDPSLWDSTSVTEFKNKWERNIGGVNADIAAQYFTQLKTTQSEYAAVQTAVSGTKAGQFYGKASVDAIPAGMSGDQYRAIKDTEVQNIDIAKTASREIISDYASMTQESLIKKVVGKKTTKADSSTKIDSSIHIAPDGTRVIFTD